MHSDDRSNFYVKCPPDWDFHYSVEKYGFLWNYETFHCYNKKYPLSSKRETQERFRVASMHLEGPIQRPSYYPPYARYYNKRLSEALGFQKKLAGESNTGYFGEAKGGFLFNVALGSKIYDVDGPDNLC